MPSNPTPTAEHRRAAAEAILGVADFHRLERQLPEVFKPWLETGDVTMLARVFINGRSDDMVNTAKAIANEGARATTELSRVFTADLAKLAALNAGKPDGEFAEAALATTHVRALVRAIEQWGVTDDTIPGSGPIAEAYDTAKAFLKARTNG